MLEGGWLKIHRKMSRWGWISTPSTFNTFLHLLLLANYEDVQFKNITIHAGQLVTSVAALVDFTGLTTKQVRRAIKNLEKTGEIVTKGTNKYTLITICNYEKYQVFEDAEGQTKGKQRANKGQAEGQQWKNNKESKNDNNIEEKEINKRKRPSVQEVQDYCTERHNGIDAEECIAFYESRGWKSGKTTIVDWKAAIRTWERKEKQNYRTIIPDARRGTEVPSKPNYEQGL